MLAPQASLEQVYAGLGRLEKILDYISSESSRVYKQYPEIPEQALLIEEKLRPEFERLRKNTEATASSVRFWYLKLKHRKEFSDLMKRIGEKIREVGTKTQRD